MSFIFSSNTISKCMHVYNGIHNTCIDITICLGLRIHKSGINAGDSFVVTGNDLSQLVTSGEFRYYGGPE